MKNKNVIIGITGGIAAYKAAILIRLLVKNNNSVKVLMTPFAKHFITPLTLATLSKNPVITEFYNPENGDWNSHVDMGLWADAMIIAPATANTIGKAANGIADNLLLTSYFSARCPVFWAPAMDLDMYSHVAVQKNIETLKKNGNHIIEAESGELASGLDGKGRMAEPENIFEYLNDYFNENQAFKGGEILITAGPTRENIDPVRFISNRSSGKMGYAIAKAFADRGAKVKLVSGPVNISIDNPNIEIIKVETADEMYDKTNENFLNCNIAVFSAAVADYKIENTSLQKIKKEKKAFEIKLSPTKDIAMEMSKIKTEKHFTVGFALETENEIENAKKKLSKKKFDLIILNSLNDKGAGFETETNKVCLIDKNNNMKYSELKSKDEIAKDIVIEVEKLFNK